MNKVTLTQTKSFNVIPSSDTTKGSLEKIISKMAKMDSELKEVKEKRCTSTAVVGEIKDQGQLNYTITFILLNRIFVVKMSSMWQRSSFCCLFSLLSMLYVWSAGHNCPSEFYCNCLSKLGFYCKIRGGVWKPLFSEYLPTNQEIVNFPSQKIGMKFSSKISPVLNL